MSLHLIQRRAGYAACAAMIQPDDVIVLLGEGCAALLDGANNCYATKLDVEERGLTNFLDDTVTLIDDAQLVELCVTHSPSVTWTKG